MRDSSMWPTRPLTKHETELLIQVVGRRMPSMLSDVSAAAQGSLDDARRDAFVDLLTEELLTAELDHSGEPTARGVVLDDLIGVLLGNIHGPDGGPGESGA